MSFNCTGLFFQQGDPLGRFDLGHLGDRGALKEFIDPRNQRILLAAQNLILTQKSRAFDGFVAKQFFQLLGAILQCLQLAELHLCHRECRLLLLE